MTFTWNRTNGRATTISGNADFVLASVPVGQTVTRVVWGWEALAIIKTWQWELLEGARIYSGVQTVGSGFGGSRPHPSDNPLLDVAYPTQRWLHHEAAELVAANMVTWDHHDRALMIKSRGTLDERAAVKQALNTLVGQTLQVFLSTSCPALAGLSQEYTVSFWAGVLYQLWPRCPGHGGTPGRQGSWRMTCTTRPR